MEFNLPPWLFTWAQLFFMAYIFLAVVPAAKFLFENNKELTGTRPELFLHLLGKVGLDIALIMGASGAAIAMMGSLVNYQSDERRIFSGDLCCWNFILWCRCDRHFVLHNLP